MGLNLRRKFSDDDKIKILQEDKKFIKRKIYIDNISIL
jgi:arsenate reductase-like glutaredoxin family protein